jgi:DNA invertase Pin-like site-specific DNA recombinase
MGRFLLTQMAAVAELEAGLISERTKAALKVARGRRQVGNKEALAVIKAHAQERAQTCELSSPTCVTRGLRASARLLMNLNRRAILTPRRGRWHPTSVLRLLKRLA